MKNSSRLPYIYSIQSSVTWKWQKFIDGHIYNEFSIHELNIWSCLKQRDNLSTTNTHYWSWWQAEVIQILNFTLTHTYTHTQTHTHRACKQIINKKITVIISIWTCLEVYRDVSITIKYVSVTCHHQIRYPPLWQPVSQIFSWRLISSHSDIVHILIQVTLLSSPGNKLNKYLWMNINIKYNVKELFNNIISIIHFLQQSKMATVIQSSHGYDL